MANPKHVEIVREGVDAIAEWRKAHPRTRLDLSGADLSGADLRSADLTAATLVDGNLRAADLTGANLSRSNLVSANLAGANLRGANLTKAALHLADFYGANFRETDLTGAFLGYAQLGALDLSKTKGIEFVRHFRPSTIGVDTLLDSCRGAGGNLTAQLGTFFRGAGVPEELLKEVPRIVAEVKYCSCFISYGQHDLEFAKKLTEDLRAKGVSCWLWETDKTVGQRTQHEIEEKLEEYEKIVVLCSIHSLLGNGIRREIDRQLAKDPDKLVPVSLEEGWRHDNYKVDCLGTDLKPFLIDRNYADFANKPYEEALAELLKGLRRP